MGVLMQEKVWTSTSERGSESQPHSKGVPPRACISHQPGLAPPRGGRACDTEASAEIDNSAVCDSAPSNDQYMGRLEQTSRLENFRLEFQT